MADNLGGRPVPPAFGPTEVFGGVDELEPAVAVVRVAFALTRTQLVTTLGIGFAGLADDQTPESLTDDEVRLEVEGTLATDALVELDRQITRDEARVWSPEQQRVMGVLAAAVDRAYSPRPDPEPLPVQEPRYEGGTVTLQTLDHGEVTVPEPAWCMGHDGELVCPRSEVSHEGPEITAVVAEAPLMRANLTHAPFLEIEPEPHPLVYVEALEAASYDADGLRELVAAGRAFLDQLEAMAGQLDALAEGGQS